MNKPLHSEIDLQFKPDWSYYGTAKELEEYLSSFKFNGPGWYVAKDGSTLLIIPSIKPADGLVWRQESAAETLYGLHAFTKTPFDAFNAIASAPVRLDDRDSK